MVINSLLIIFNFWFSLIKKVPRTTNFKSMVKQSFNQPNLIKKMCKTGKVSVETN